MENKTWQLKGLTKKQVEYKIYPEYTTGTERKTFTDRD